MSKPKEVLRVHYSQLILSRSFPKRSDLGDIGVLKKALLAVGIREPISARILAEDAYQVIHGRGYRRVIAINELIKEGHLERFKWVPVRVAREGSEVDDAINLLIEETREPMPVQTVASVIYFLLSQGLGLSEISATSGFPESRLREVLAKAGKLSEARWTESAIVSIPKPADFASRRDELLASLNSTPDGKAMGRKLAAAFDYMEGRCELEQASQVLLGLRK